MSEDLSIVDPKMMDEAVQIKMSHHWFGPAAFDEAKVQKELTTGSWLLKYTRRTETTYV